MAQIKEFMVKTNQSKLMTLRPMPLWESILFFGIPAIITIFCVYGLFPYLVKHGFSAYISYVIALDIPLFMMFVASLVAYRMEGNPMNWPAFRDRFRLKRMEHKGWIWTIGLLFFMIITAGLLSVLVLSIIPDLIEKGMLTIPDSTPSFIDPRVPQSLAGIKTQMGAKAVGNWFLLVITFFSLILNILGEEFLWRGYVLPRQELMYGKYAWMVHGVLWMLLHAFKWWQMLALLPGALALSFLAQRIKNTWPGIIAHFITNGIGMIGILLVVMGVGE